MKDFKNIKMDDFHNITEDTYDFDDADLFDKNNSFGKIGNGGGKIKNKKHNKSIIALYLFVLIIIWVAFFINYISTNSKIAKYNTELSSISTAVNNNSALLEKLKNNLSFFKNIKSNQVNIANLLYNISIHKFSAGKLKSVIIKDGRVYLQFIVYKNNFLNSLNNLMGYKVYLNMNKNKIFTGRFKIVSLVKVVQKVKDDKNQFKALLVSNNKK
jgi:TM2 domain-containing membrane protein YozV